MVQNIGFYFHSLYLLRHSESTYKVGNIHGERVVLGIECVEGHLQLGVIDVLGRVALVDWVN